VSVAHQVFHSALQAAAAEPGLMSADIRAACNAAGAADVRAAAAGAGPCAADGGAGAGGSESGAAGDCAGAAIGEACSTSGRAGAVAPRPSAAGGGAGAGGSKWDAAGGCAGAAVRRACPVGGGASGTLYPEGSIVHLQRLFVLSPRFPVAPAGFDAVVKAVWSPGYSAAQCTPYFVPNGTQSSTQCLCARVAVPQSVVTLDYAADRRTVYVSVATMERLLSSTRDSLPSYSPMFAVRHDKLMLDVAKPAGFCVSACWLPAEFEDYLLPVGSMLSKDMLFRSILYSQVLHFWTSVYERTKLHCLTHRGRADISGEDMLVQPHACFA